jgi:phosphoribosyl 1,2-cyclic phosphate phosphodiesterase
MKVTFLGTGTSQGVPVIACGCAVCKSNDSRDKRLRCSIALEFNGHLVVIDTGPDFRQQMLRQGIQKLDAVIYTHEHKDHTAGLDDIRAFNYFMGRPIDLYLSEYVEQALRREFAYIFDDDKYPGIPQVDLHQLKNEPFLLFGQEVIPIQVNHYKLPVFGYRIGDFCYITDAKTIAAEERSKLKGLKYLVINALRKETHTSHLTLQEALDIIAEVKPEYALITHISHQLGLHQDIEAELPENVKLAYDGLELIV